MEDDAFFYTVMEPCQGGDLSQLSKKLPRDDVVTEDSLRESVSTPCGAAHMMSALRGIATAMSKDAYSVPGWELVPAVQEAPA